MAAPRCAVPDTLLLIAAAAVGSVITVLDLFLS